MTFIAILIWEALVITMGIQFIKSVGESGESDGKTLALFVLFVVFFGLAILPFTSAFSPS